MNIRVIIRATDLKAERAGAAFPAGATFPAGAGDCE